MGRLFHRNYDKTWGTISLNKEQNHLEEVKSLLSNGAKIDATDSNGASILLNIIESHPKGWKETALFLIENGADVNLRDRNGEDALIKACRHKDGLDVVKAIKGKGASINHKSKDTSRSNRPPRPSTFALKEAVRCGNADVVDFLVDNGAKVKQKDSIGCEAIAYLECSDENAKILKKLVENGADVNAENWFGVTRLMEAASKGSFSSFKYLVNSKADINKVSRAFSYDYNGNLEFVNVPERTALSVAIDFGQLEIAEYAIKNGAEVDTNTIDRLKDLSRRKNIANNQDVDHLELKKNLLQGMLKEKLGKTGDVKSGRVRNEHYKTAITQTEISKAAMQVKRAKGGNSK